MIVENCLPEIVFQHYVLCFNQMIDIPRETHTLKTDARNLFLRHGKKE